MSQSQLLRSPETLDHSLRRKAQIRGQHVHGGARHHWAAIDVPDIFIRMASCPAATLNHIQAGL